MPERLKNILKKEKVLCLIGMFVMIAICLGEIELYSQNLIVYWMAFVYVNYLFEDQHQWKLGLLVIFTIVKVVLNIYCIGIDTSIFLILYFGILGVFFIVKDKTKYKKLQIISLILAGVVGISGSFYIMENKLIKDRGLEKRIETELFFEIAKKEEVKKLTVSDLENVRRIFIYTKDHVRNLEGIEHLKNLEKIYNVKGQVKNLDKLALLPKLKRIEIEDAKTKELSVINKLKNLEELRIVYCKMDNTFLIEYLPKLKILDIQGNDLDDLSFARNLKSVQKLDISYCKIKRLDGIEKLKNLKEVFLDNTEIEDISAISKLKYLEKIYINESEIHNVELLKKLPNLKELTIDSKRIDALSNEN